MPASPPPPSPLPTRLRQLIADLQDPAVSYLLAAHYYDHPRYRHFPAMFPLRQGETSNVEVGPNFVAFDTALVRYPDRGEPHYPGPWADHFRGTVPFAQLYPLCRQVLPLAGQGPGPSYYGPEPYFITTQPCSTAPLRCTS